MNNYDGKIKIDYNNADGFNCYCDEIMTEYNQCIEEGLDIEQYKELFQSVADMKGGEEKTQQSEKVFEAVINASLRADFPYNEPNKLGDIRKLRKLYDFTPKAFDDKSLRNKLTGAWTGRAVGCLLGKTVEGIRCDEFIHFLKETGNYPMHRYILSTDVTKEIKEKYKFFFYNRAFADTVDGMPVDDDTNYVVLSQKIIEDYGRAFAPEDVATAWLKYQSVYSYFTAERVAYINFMNCIEPPSSATYKNPYREWIGAQIRGDYFGYINPGNPEAAAEMAYNDACISHTKNGIYGEMFISAMLACAAVTSSIEDIIFGGLAQIPATSRLYEAIVKIYNAYKNGVSVDECFSIIHSAYDEHTGHGWCHVIPNAMIVVAGLLYGEGDFGKSICTAVGMAFDTDCNGATVGSILGVRGGIECIDDYWKKPINNKIHTSIFGVETVNIEKAVEKTIEHIKQN